MKALFKLLFIKHLLRIFFLLMIYTYLTRRGKEEKSVIVFSRSLHIATSVLASLIIAITTQRLR